MKDLTNPFWIKLKGFRFCSSYCRRVLVFLDNPKWQTGG